MPLTKVNMLNYEGGYIDPAYVAAIVPQGYSNSDIYLIGGVMIRTAQSADSVHALLFPEPVPKPMPLTTEAVVEPIAVQSAPKRVDIDDDIPF